MQVKFEMSFYRLLTSIILCMCSVYSGPSDPRWTVKDNSIFYTMVELVCADGYPIQEHNVVTEDGYILTVHRIPNGKRRPKVPRKLSHYGHVHKGYHPDFEKCYNESRFETADGIPVILAHGLLAASDNWVLQGPGNDLAYLLADDGYDVWFTNIRGNFYGRAHKTIHPSNPKFWDFSFHECGIYDLTATIDHILKVSKHKKVMYIGHSMGTTMFFVMGAVKPEYNNKVILFVGYAPVGQVKDEHYFPARRTVLTFGFNVIKSLKAKGVCEMFPRSTLLITLEKLICGENSPVQDTCYDLPFSFVGYHSRLISRRTLPLVVSHVLSGNSVKTIDHFVQLSTSNYFKFYNYGKEKNLRVYGQEDAPRYDLRKVTTPSALFYSLHDYIVDGKDAALLLDYLPNVVENQIVDKYNHADFMWAYNAKDVLYKRTLELLDRFRKQSHSKSNSLTA